MGYMYAITSWWNSPHYW